MHSPFAFLDSMARVLLWTAGLHALVALACLAALGFTAPGVMGVHPALKPLKFAVSIAMFLATMGVVLPSLSVSASTRGALAWTFASTMAIEMLVIGAQALRGTTSHFNVSAPLDTALWNFMMVAIVAATVGIGFVTVVATLRPMLGTDGGEPAPLTRAAWRIGLWLLLLSPVSGFAMGARQRHSVGGGDGGPGLPFVNWSVQHGDLRVSHFVALHAVQLLPFVAWLLARAPLPQWCRAAAFGVAAFTAVGFCVGTLIQSFAGRPLLLRRS